MHKLSSFYGKMNRRAFISSSLSSLFLISYPQIALAKKRLPVSDLNKTAYITDPVFLQHHIAKGHPETPERMLFIQNEIQQSSLLEKLIPFQLKQIRDEDLTLVHTQQHIDAIKQYTPVADQVARAGVGACLAAIDGVMQGKLDNAFCATRPPGHHALNTGREEGFCYYNNIAIAARYAQKKYQIKRVLIIDWDYHHGNATELTFYADPDILFFSTHDQYAYPGTGDPARTGTGNGLGFNINVHLPCNSNDQAIIAAFKNKLLPTVDQFKPELVLISAGFDSRKDDLLGCFAITDAGFAELTRIAMQIAIQHCHGRLVSVLEGGYNLKGNAKAVVEHVSTLTKKL